MSWDQVAIGEVAEIVSGATPKSSVADYWGGDVAWATPTDLSKLKGKHLAHTERTITRKGLSSCAARVLPANSVLFSSRAPIGLVAINTKPMATNQGFKSFVPSNELDANFLFWWLNANRQRLEDLGTGATFKEVSKRVVSEVQIPLPPIGEQRRIAAILDKADAIRRKREQALDQADEFLKSVFVDMFGDPASGTTEFATTPLGELVDPSRGISYGIVQRGPETPNGVPVVRISNIVTDRFDGMHLVRTSKEISSKYRRTVLKGGELLLSIRGTVGRVAISPAEAAGFNVSREVAVIPLLDGVDPVFVRALMLTDGAQRFMTENIKGVAQRGINLKDVRLLPVPRPSEEIVSKFTSIVERTNSIVKKLGVDAPLFEALSQRAFSGSL
ncbi:MULTISPECIES: restriction endonuclease subunit S [unclassified Roseovarius]|uniref:restriction endonuclease subunit S n=1 Tax=unclassified Roseovarius TaxID=2614913 RepID=UPI00273F94DC|nr:restriction endonuclease subunit S [Roseovarius sp. MMSF_3350]